MTLRHDERKHGERMVMAMATATATAWGVRFYRGGMGLSLRRCSLACGPGHCPYVYKGAVQKTPFRIPTLCAIPLTFTRGQHPDFILKILAAIVISTFIYTVKIPSSPVLFSLPCTRKQDVVYFSDCQFIIFRRPASHHRLIYRCALPPLCPRHIRNLLDEVRRQDATR